MWWKIYFWISSIVAGLNVIVLIRELMEGKVSGFLPVVASVVYALAVYTYIYKKHVFSQRLWKTWLVIVLIVHVLRFYAVLPSDNVWDLATITLILLGSILFPLPAWYCVYRLGFDKKEQVKITKISKKKVTTKKAR